MKSSLKKELPFLFLVAAPSLYLAVLWDKMPENVPLHWNIHGEIDSRGPRESLWVLAIVMPLLVYGIFMIAPKIDPKKQIDKMGNKYSQLKFVMVGFITLIILFLIYSAHDPSNSNIQIIYILIGLLFVFLGNYMKTVRPNYYIGIRTPWTLEHETIWKKTHVLGGKVWFIAGFVIILGALLINGEAYFMLLMTIAAIVVLVPVIYSYIQYKALKD